MLVNGCQVRNEAAGDFLSLLKEWETLCEDFSLLGSRRPEVVNPIPNGLEHDSDEDEDDDGSSVPHGEFEVKKLVAICYGDPNEINKPGLYFKVSNYNKELILHAKLSLTLTSLASYMLCILYLFLSSATVIHIS